MSRHLLLAALAWITPLSLGQAASVLFDFTSDGLSIEGDATQSMTVDGVTLSSVSISLDGVINTTASGLGINTSGADTPGSFDNIIATESWTFEFSQEIVSITLDFGSLVGADEFLLTSPNGDFAPQSINDSTTNASKEFTVSSTIPAGNDLTLTFNTADPAASTLNSIVVMTISEPSATLLVLLGLSLTALTNRQRPSTHG